MTDLQAAYVAAAGRVADLVRDLDDVALATPVPACPGWTVHDVVAHLTGVASDVNEGRQPYADGVEWTAAQVDARRGVPIAAVLAEWVRETPGIATAAGAGARHFAFDVLTHEQDIRGALKQPGEREAGLLVLHEAAIGALDRRVTESGLPALWVATGEDSFQAGEGEPGVTVEVDRYELIRAAFGRRSARQIGQWGWAGDSTPYVPLIPVLPMADRDVIDD